LRKFYGTILEGIFHFYVVLSKITTNMELNDALKSAARKMEITDPVSTAMSKSVVVANQFHNFSAVLELFSKYGMHHLPIVDANGKIIGIVSSNDLMKIFTEPKFKSLSLNTDEADKVINISDIMTKDVVTISPNATIKEAAKIFTEGGFLAMPVVDNGQIVGILSVRDLVHVIAYFS
jgi:CBS domain-containing protein